MKLLKFSFVLLVLLSSCSNVTPPTATVTLPPAPPTSVPTVTATATPLSLIDSLDISPEIKREAKEQGIEDSIRFESGKYYSVLLFWDENGEISQKDVLVNPTTLSKDSNISNDFNPITIQTLDSKILLWSQEHNGWFVSVEIKIDNIKEPIFVPLGFQDVLFKSLLLNPDTNVPFSPDTRFSGLRIVSQYDKKTGEKSAYLRTTSEYDPDITADQLEVKWTNTWFYTRLEDGTIYQFTPTKWLDPKDQNKLDMRDFKFIFCAIGTEITGGTSTKTDMRDTIQKYSITDSNEIPHPILAASDGFFESIVLLHGISGRDFLQPSLGKLFGLPGNDPGRLDPFRSIVARDFQDLNTKTPLFETPLTGDTFHINLDPSVQTMIIPCSFGNWTGTK